MTKVVRKRRETMKITREILKKQYKKYVREIESENADREMYDGDVYMPTITPLTFEEWLEEDHE